MEKLHRNQDISEKPPPFELARSVVVFVAMLLLSAPAFAQDRSETYEGRRLADALQALQARGLRIVFSTEIVTPGMRVVAEPHAKVEREMLDELLAPHGLKAEGGPGVVILVVRAKPPKAVDSRKQLNDTRTGAIQGHVVDAVAHSPLPGILVRVVGTEQTARTDQEGRFQLRYVPAGTQTLSVSVAGYALVRRTVRVTSGRTVAVTIALAQDAGTLRRF